MKSGNPDQLAFKHADQEFHYSQHTYFNTGIKYTNYKELGRSVVHRNIKHLFILTVEQAGLHPPCSVAT